MQVRNLTPTIGSEITGVDLSQPLDAATTAKIREVWESRGVVIFPGQAISDEAQVAFSRNFGELEMFPQSSDRLDAVPEIFRLGNVDSEGKMLPVEDETAKFNQLTWFWHTDSCYRPIPSKGAILHGLLVSEEGGETIYANLRAALTEMPAEMRARINGLISVHSFHYLRTLKNLPPMKPEEAAALPAVQHPLIRNHQDGSQSLYISPPYMENIVGWDRDETQELIDELTEWATQDRFTYRHKWRADDILMWDNTWTMHVVTPYDSAQVPRVMHRTTILGTEAVL